MSINWEMGLMPNIGGNALAAFHQGRQMVTQERQQAEDRQMRMQDREMQALKQLSAEQREQAKQRMGMLGDAAQWADTPEKWDQAIDYLAQQGLDVAQYKGKFSPETRMAAISSAGELKSYLDRQAPTTVGPGAHLVDPTGKALFSAPFAPRPVTVSEGQTVVEYAPGTGGGKSMEDVWSGMIQTESRGNHFGSDGKPLTSPAGAIGIAQVMPGTAPEAAALAGVQFDENRYRNDPEYNATIGRAYFEKQVQTFGGDTEKAVAAYNAGPGRVQKAIEKGGDRWKEFLPAETKDYLQSVLGPAGSRVIAQGAPKQPKQQWRTLSPDEAQKMGLPAGTYQQSPEGEIKPIGGIGDKAPQSKEAYSQSAMDAFDRAIKTAGGLLTHPGFATGVGMPSINPFDGNLAGFVVPGSVAADFRTKLTTMKAQVFLPMVQSMKGMGALSNAEGEKLTAAIGNLDPSQSESQFKESVEQIIADLKTYRDRAKQPAAASPAKGGWGKAKVVG
tara:strand:+ start:171 stop:1676 length:1506 start_codon:yes stop_codon:yes gene_type:complete